MRTMENQENRQPRDSRLCERCRYSCKHPPWHFVLFCPRYDSSSAPQGVEHNIIADICVLTCSSGRRIVYVLN